MNSVATCLRNNALTQVTALGPSKYKWCLPCSLERQLSTTAASRHLIVNLDVNLEMATLDGIDTCGERAFDAILELVEEINNCPGSAGRNGIELEAAAQPQRRVAEMSFVGYSLGGLIMRYVVGRL